MTGAHEASTPSQAGAAHCPLTQCLQLSERGSHLCLLGTRCVSRGEGGDGGHQTAWRRKPMGSTGLDGDPACGGGRVEGGQQGQGREGWALIAGSVRTLR